NDLEFDRYTILKYAKENGEDERMVKQRIRRAVKKALGNMAAMGVEDYYNEIFQTYSYMIFDFESIRSEMDFIRGKNQNGGKASISKFIEGLMTFTESKE
ncbi:MAG: DNA-binding domain-containing protein, partial [Anaerovoracaceae bacterium]